MNYTNQKKEFNQRIENLVIKEDEHFELVKEYQQKMIKLKGFLDEKLEQNEPIYVVVDGSDYDGLMSFITFKKQYHNTQLLGFYHRQNKEISINFVNNDYEYILKNKDVVCIDCEMHNMINITNHYSYIKSNPLSLNFIPYEFKNKNPLSTYAILRSMFNKPVNVNTFFYADGGQFVYHNYTYNLMRWSKVFRSVEDGIRKLRVLEEVPLIKRFEEYTPWLKKNGFNLEYFANNLTRNFVSFDFLDELKKDHLIPNDTQVVKQFENEKVVLDKNEVDVQLFLSNPNNPMIQCNRITSNTWVGFSNYELKQIIKNKKQTLKFALNK